MERALALDQYLFLLINHLPHAPEFDSIALFLSGIGAFGFIWFVLGALLLIREEKKDHRFFLPLTVTAITSWQLIEMFLKPWIGRARPSEDGIGALVIEHGFDGFSWPSGHATLAFALAVVLTRKEPQWRWFFYILATLIALSRVYLGKHYPFDVLSGSIIGYGIGRTCLQFFNLPSSTQKNINQPHRRKQYAVPRKRNHRMSSDKRHKEPDRT